MMQINIQLFGGRGVSSIARRFASRQMGGNGGKAIPIDISKIKDKTLSGIEDRIRVLQHEEAFIFDNNDRLVAGVSGGNSSVGIPNDWKNMDGATVTHGHPTGKYGYGGTLSPADAYMMASTQWKEIRAAAQGQGEFNYIMRRTASSDNAGLRDQIAKDRGILEDTVKKTFSAEYKNAIKAGKSKISALKEAAQKGRGTVDLYWKRTLPQYGFEYVSRNRRYKYER